MAERKIYRAKVKDQGSAIVTPDDSKIFSWGNIGGQGFSLGDANFIMQDTGGGSFTCQLANLQNPITEESFYASGLGLHDANGLELYRIPQFSVGTISATPAFASVSLFFPGYMYAYVTNLVLYQ